jgi:8-oxo-dGTP diphosphatase
MKHQVSKDIVVAALITDEAGRVLIVKPDHKDGWIFPGGYVEVGESPSSACRREIEAELGVSVDGPNKLLSVDYRGQTDEYVMFIFDGGVFTDEMIASIKLPPQLTEYRFVTPEDAQKLLRMHSARRLAPTMAARNATGIAYLEDQEAL